MRKPVKAKSPDTIAMLRAMPPDERANALVGMFQIVASEFAHLVLDHVKAAKPAKRRKAKPPQRKMKRRD